MSDGERVETGLLRRLLPDPEVAILLVAGVAMIFLGVPVPKAVPLIVVAVLLDLEHFSRTQELAERLEQRSRPLILWVQSSGRPQLAAGLLVALAVGFPDRQTWPSTLAVSLVGVAGVWLAYVTPPAVDPGPLPPSGAVAWLSVFLALAVWELVNLFQQPDLQTGSFDHPTLSVLADPVLDVRLWRILFVGVWLALGRWLLGLRE